ncbi:hypothetical protein [Mongoliitalea daihaiensis]|uniref:hypothetical protein n=1 Tax=Mongoliitalea daihaiensis TaxID=2782006 RepID=UPI001F375582|nr:hypothetical protein [Mongoliitalea daihaiensis]UJP64018.1 hypothetical protein IPZ59_14480 [Mongoliitalea daihaiensis]
MLKYWLVTEISEEAPFKWELFQPQDFDELMVLMEIIWISQDFVWFAYEDGEFYTAVDSKQEAIDLLAPQVWYHSYPFPHEEEDVELPF